LYKVVLEKKYNAIVHNDRMLYEQLIATWGYDLSWVAGVTEQIRHWAMGDDEGDEPLCRQLRGSKALVGSSAIIPRPQR
jgi:hypothetical protein